MFEEVNHLLKAIDFSKKKEMVTSWDRTYEIMEYFKSTQYIGFDGDILYDILQWDKILTEINSTHPAFKITEKDAKELKGNLQYGYQWVTDDMRNQYRNNTSTVSLYELINGVTNLYRRSELCNSNFRYGELGWVFTESLMNEKLPFIKKICNRPLPDFELN